MTSVNLLRVVALLAALFVAQPANAQTGARDLIRDQPTVTDRTLGAALNAFARVRSSFGSAINRVLPPLPSEIAGLARGDGGSELSRLLGLAGYKLKEIENEVGIIPSLSFKFALARELSEADKDYLDEEIEHSSVHSPGYFADLQRAIVHTVAAINATSGIQVADVYVTLLPLPGVSFTVSPTEVPLGEEASALMRAIQRVDQRIRSASTMEMREGAARPASVQSLPPAAVAQAPLPRDAALTQSRPASDSSQTLVIGVVLTILAGLGQFFIGMKLLSTYLKEAAGDRVRQMVGRLARKPGLLALVGLFAGGVTQSTNAVTAAATGLATVEIITLRQAFPLIACANIGTSILVFLAAVNIGNAILAATALCGALFFAGLDQSRRYRAVVGAFLALILIITGLALVQSGARAIRDVHEIRDVIAMLSGSVLGALLVGAVLTPIVQTAKTVAAIAASLAAAGLITPDGAMIIVIGANLTSAANTAFLTARVSRKGRGLGIYQGLLKAIGSFIALPVILIMTAYDPLYFHGIGPGQAALLVAVTYLAMQVVAYLVTLPFERQIERKIIDFVGPDDPTEFGRPRFISAEALREPATATVLAFREHVAALERLPEHLDGVRDGGGLSADAAHALGGQIASILKATDDFLRALGQEANDQAVRDRVNSMQRLNGLAVSLQEQARDLAVIVGGKGAHTPEVAARLSAIVESAHLLLDSFVGFVQAPDGAGREMLSALTGDRAAVMEGVRRAVMSSGEAEPGGQRALFDACLCFERMVWLMRRYIMICDEPSSPLAFEKPPEAAAVAAD